MKTKTPNSTSHTHILGARVESRKAAHRKPQILGMCRVMLFGVIASAFLSSCSTLTTISGYLGIGDTGNKRMAINDKNITRVVSTAWASEGNPDSHYLLARYYQQAGRFDEAVREYNKTISIDRTCVKAHNALGVLYDQFGDHLNAIEQYKQALDIDTHLDYVRNNLGYSYLLQGRYDEAIVALKEAIALNASSKRTHNNLGMAYAMNGQVDLALAEFRQTDGEAKAHANVASILYKKRLFDQAKMYYALALAIDPNLTSIQEALTASEALARISALTDTKRGIPQQALLDKTFIGLVAHADVASDERPIGESETNELANAGVEISNGNGVRQMASKVANILSANGVKVVRLTNAKHFHYASSQIFYKQHYHQTAVQVAKNIPGIHNLAMMSEPERDNVKIKVLIGKDLVAPISPSIKEIK